MESAARSYLQVSRRLGRIANSRGYLSRSDQNSTIMLRWILSPVVGLAVLFILPSARVVGQAAALQVVEVVFTPDMDNDDLERIEEEMKVQGIDLHITNKNFNDGLLEEITFSVSTAKGSGKAEGEIRLGERFGFRYDPRPGAEVPFSVGSLR